MKMRNKDLEEVFEIVTISHINSGTPNGNGDYPVEYISLEGIDEEGDIYEFLYKSLKELNTIWEDYPPAEPLIKDEKVRKAVRAWADYNKVKIVRYVVDNYRNSRLYNTGKSLVIDFAIELQGINEGDDYTIAELCGEEEEC